MVKRIPKQLKTLAGKKSATRDMPVPLLGLTFQILCNFGFCILSESLTFKTGIHFEAFGIKLTTLGIFILKKDISW